METIIIKTKKNKEIVDITDIVNKILQEKKWEQGICHLFLMHTTAALTTADLDPGTDLDMLDAFEAIMPPHQSEARYGAGKIKYRHPHNPEHVGDHIMASLIGASLTVPVEAGKLILGTWQRVVVAELDGPRERQIQINFIKID